VLEINGKIYLLHRNSQSIPAGMSFTFIIKSTTLLDLRKFHYIYLFEAIANRMITTTGKTRQAMQIMSPANVLSLVMYHIISEIIQFQEHSAESTLAIFLLGSQTSTFS
jgi:hypothetical protein